MKIAHTADIHIRGLSRHEEYRKILKFFADDCLSQKVDHIFVGGDIFHTKTSGISPEYIEFLTWWLNYMSKVAPVYLVLGNHDLNLSNLSRQDAVTPIVEAMANPRVFLYKKSGVYNFAPGYNWCVFSCFDEAGWKDVKPTAGDINIATFHGPVRGSVTETGWDIDEENITADYFKDYDFCMLGDIHKQQFLGYRDGKPWIGYPGTPIQQNYAEELNHGYYLWEIKNSSEWSVVNRPLPNIKPFITIDWAGSLDKTVKIARSCPQGTRFRVRSSVSLTQDEVYVLSETLKTSMNASEVTYKIDTQFDAQLVKTSTLSVKKTDLRSPEIISKFLRDYYKDFKLNEKEIDELSVTAKFYLSQLASDNLSRNAKWTLRRLEWDNLFSYGEHNVMDFEKLNGIVGIFGPNRTGKSSIVGALMYAFFNSTDRGPVKNVNICNVRKNYCSSRAIFDHNGLTYVLERQTTKNTSKKGVVSAATSLNLFRMKDDDEEMEDLCGEQRTDTEKTLRNLLGMTEDFLITTLSAQGDTNNFLLQGSTKRRSILLKFLDLDVFDKLHDLASKEVSSIKSQLKNFPDRNWEEIRAQNEQLIKDNTDNITKFEDLINESQTSLSLLSADLLKHNASPVTQEDVVLQENRVNNFEKKFKECKENVVILEQEIESLQQKSEILQTLIDSIDVKSLKEKQESYRNLFSIVTDVRHDYEKEDSVLALQNKSLKILDDVPCGDNYPSCKFIKDAYINKKQLPEQEKKVASILSLLNEACASLEKLKDDSISDKLSKHEKAYKLSDNIKVEISKKEMEIVKLQTTCSTCASSLFESKLRLNNLQSSLNNDEAVEVVSIRTKILCLTAQLKLYDKQKLESASQLGKLQSTTENLEDEKSTRDSLLRNVRMHELVANAFSKRGIPLLVTKTQLPLINLEISKILQGIVDFTLEVESDEDTDTLEIYINYGDSRRIIELCSGMEKTISAIALRVAMLNVSSLPKSDFFIIDEGFGTLDSAGVEACGKFLYSLKRYFKSVLVITHVDGIKDTADCIVEITKNEKDSKVVYI